MSSGPVKLFFVCSENQHRSRTCEDVYKSKPGFAARSAGTWPSAKQHVTKKDLEWADLVLAMDASHSEDIKRNFPRWWEKQSRKIEVLDIKDEHFTREALERLRPICEEKVTQVLRKRKML